MKNDMRLRVYACGGAATNICKSQIGSATSDGFADLNGVFVDTAESNLTKEINREMVFLIDGIDGSGKVRAENHQAINDSIKQLLLQHVPGHFNIIVFSAGGGSGSVFGPLMVQEMIRRDIPVITVVIGGDESAISANNTMNTIKSLSAIAQNSGKPIPMVYRNNGESTARRDIDGVVRSDIACLAALFNERNAELDTADLTNLIFFNRVTSVEPTLALLSLVNGDLAKGCPPNPISIASLMLEPGMNPPNVHPEYSCVGYPPEADCELNKDLHFVIGTDGIEPIVNAAQVSIDNYNEIAESRIRRKSQIVSADDEVSETGLIL